VDIKSGFTIIGDVGCADINRTTHSLNILKAPVPALADKTLLFRQRGQFGHSGELVHGIRIQQSAILVHTADVFFFDKAATSAAARVSAKLILVVTSYYGVE
jgi:hypothetical protein